MPSVATPFGASVKQIPTGPAEMVLRGGTFYTPGMERSRPGAVAISGGRIVYAGPEEGVAAWVGPRTQVVEVRGGLILPGFQDGHVHPLMGGQALLECPLFEQDSLEGYLGEVRRCGEAGSGQSFIRGRGWMSSVFPPTGPDKRQLDQAVADRPVLLKALDAHSVWVNSKALEMAGITAETPDPPGGRIERYPGSNEPSGVLREWSAMSMVENLLPPPSHEEKLAAARAYMEFAAQLGVTGVHEALAYREQLELYRELARNGELTVRLNVAVVCEPEDGVEFVPELMEMCRDYSTGLLTVRTGKFFMDGVAEGHTAFLLEPYSDMPGFRSQSPWEREAWLRMARALDQEGIQMHLHAIGDGAIRMGLDGLEYARRMNGPRGNRHQVAHLDLVLPSDIRRLRDLGAVANLQPWWFYEDEVFRENLLPALGPERAGRLYPARSIFDAGVAVACGSDWPAGGDFVSCNPLDGIQIGMTRRGLEPDAAPVSQPEQRLTLRELLDSFTMGAAYANFHEHETGSLTPGKSADIVVLDRDLFDVPPETISQAKVLLTLFQGKTVYRDSALSGC
jgi:predicted amidohydrolase YtcJ